MRALLTWLSTVSLAGLALVAALPVRPASHTYPTGPVPGAAPVRPGPLPLSALPGLVLEPQHVDLGALAPGAERVVEVTWRRRGDGPLHVLAVRPGCGCAAASGLPPDPPPGAEGVLRVDIAAPRTLGPFALRVCVVTDAPGPGALAVLTLQGYVDSPLAAHPPRLDLGSRSPGAVLERWVAVDATPSAAQGVLTATLEGVAGRVRVDPSATAGRPGWTVRLLLALPGEPGPLAGGLRLSTPEGESLFVPLDGVIVGAPDRPAGPAALSPPGG